MKVNMNSVVKVKLTNEGRRILRTYHEYVCEDFTDVPLLSEIFEEDSDGFLNIQMWKLFQIFGSSTYMGVLEVPFENNEIIFDKDSFTP